MSFFDNLAEFFVANTDSELQDMAATQRDVVAPGQSANYQRLADQGKISDVDNYFYQQEITATGNTTSDYLNQTGSASHVIAGIPWYVWLALVGVVVWYLGGFVWLRGILARK